jgi:hypothetical protein
MLKTLGLDHIQSLHDSLAEYRTKWSGNQGWSAMFLLEIEFEYY